MTNKDATKPTLGITTLPAVVSPGPRTLRYEGRKTTASNRLRFHGRLHDTYITTSNDFFSCCFVETLRSNDAAAQELKKSVSKCARALTCFQTGFTC